MQPCLYEGVSCGNGRVVALDIEGFGLHLSHLPPPVAMLTQLKALKLLGNPLKNAAIPKDMLQLQALSLEAAKGTE